ncbi:MAG: pentapeptide repeat-containing protein [Symploca sp. SIO1B1]|nr:pentapeptide repeat-containing protein [Symploca sp. SIO1C2]NES00019.1 pentapeptide repeat-containing protein [Symploca sp. SIO1B1]
MSENKTNNLTEIIPWLLISFILFVVGLLALSYYLWGLNVTPIVQQESILDIKDFFELRNQAIKSVITSIQSYVTGFGGIAILTVIGRRDTEKESENQNIDLSNTDIARATLYKANLQGAILDDADLQRVFLDRANLQGATLYGANLQGAILDDADLQGVFLNRANLQGAFLNEANLQGVFLDRANLQRAILNRANLQGALLHEANLQEALLDEANLAGAYRQDVKNLTQEQIAQSKR